MEKQILLEIPYFFELKKNYLVPLEKGFSLKSDNYEDVMDLLRAEDFLHPYPLVIGISHEGKISVKFSRPIKLPTDIALYVDLITPKITIIIEENDFMDTDEVKGAARFYKSFFTNEKNVSR